MCADGRGADPVAADHQIVLVALRHDRRTAAGRDLFVRVPDRERFHSAVSGGQLVRDGAKARFLLHAHHVVDVIGVALVRDIPAEQVVVETFDPSVCPGVVLETVGRRFALSVTGDLRDEDIEFPLVTSQHHDVQRDDSRLVHAEKVCRGGLRRQ